jgi:hypothetical protein
VLLLLRRLHALNRTDLLLGLFDGRLSDRLREGAGLHESPQLLDLRLLFAICAACGFGAMRGAAVAWRARSRTRFSSRVSTTASC